MMFSSLYNRFSLKQSLGTPGKRRNVKHVSMTEEHVLLENVL